MLDKWAHLFAIAMLVVLMYAVAYYSYHSRQARADVKWYVGENERMRDAGTAMQHTIRSLEGRIRDGTAANKKLIDDLHVERLASVAAGNELSKLRSVHRDTTTELERVIVDRTKDAMWHESIVWKKDQQLAHGNALVVSLRETIATLERMNGELANSNALLTRTFKDAVDRLFINCEELRSQNGALLSTVTGATEQLVDIAKEFAGLRRVGFHPSMAPATVPTDEDPPRFTSTSEADEAAARTGKDRMVIEASD